MCPRKHCPLSCAWGSWARREEGRRLDSSWLGGAPFSASPRPHIGGACQPTTGTHPRLCTLIFTTAHMHTSGSVASQCCLDPQRLVPWSCSQLGKPGQAWILRPFCGRHSPLSGSGDRKEPPYRIRVTLRNGVSTVPRQAPGGPKCSCDCLGIDLAVPQSPVQSYLQISLHRYSSKLNYKVSGTPKCHSVIVTSFGENHGTKSAK